MSFRCFVQLLLCSLVLEVVHASCNSSNAVFLKLSARNLPGKDYGNEDKSDPFFKFHHYGRDYYRSATKGGNHDPDWDDVVRIWQTNNLQVLQVSFWDEDPGNRDDNLGWHDVSLVRLRELTLNEKYEAPIHGQGVPGRVIFQRVACAECNKDCKCP